MQPQPSIIIADDHPLILKGLHDFLNEKGYNVLASAKNGKEALSLIKAHNPQIAILDIQMPFYTGIEIAKECQNSDTDTRIILITFEKDEKIYTKAKAMGIYGYVLKEFALAEIENCIAAVTEGKSYFSPELILHIKPNVKPKGVDALTATELKVLSLIAQNKTAKEIAKELYVSDRTIEKHKSNIRQKLSLDSKPNSILLFTKEYEEFL